jgi:peptidoglycan/xylan/chitin deacetylase (PgdA/CDA1 family)
MEIGAHGFAHHILPKLPRPELSHSVQTCKQVLEWVMGEPVRMFAYPKGRYSSQVIAELRQAGYQGARTNRMFSNTLKFDPFEMPTTVQAFPHSRTAYVKNTLRSGKVARFFDYARRYRSCRSWLELGKKTFDQVMQDGGVWHLFGHSWEIDRLNLWAELEALAEYVGGRPGVVYAGNGDTLKLLQSQNVDLVLRAQAS